MFEWLKMAMRYPCIVRSYIGENSSGNKIYKNHELCMCYPFTENNLIESGINTSIVGRNKLYLNAKIPLKSEDIIIFENVYSNEIAHIFKDINEREKYYDENKDMLVKDKSWCIIDDKIWIFNKEQKWTDSYVWNDIKDNEHIENFQGKQEIVVRSLKRYDSFLWENFPDNNNGLLIQEVII